MSAGPPKYRVNLTNPEVGSEFIAPLFLQRATFLGQISMMTPNTSANTPTTAYCKLTSETALGNVVNPPFHYLPNYRLNQ